MYVHLRVLLWALNAEHGCIKHLNDDVLWKGIGDAIPSEKAGEYFLLVPDAGGITLSARVVKRTTRKCNIGY